MRIPPGRGGVESWGKTKTGYFREYIRANADQRTFCIQFVNIFFFLCKSPKPHLTTLSHCRPGYSNKTKYGSLITIRHKFYSVHSHNTKLGSQREREREKRRRECAREWRRRRRRRMRPRRGGGRGFAWVNNIRYCAHTPRTQYCKNAKSEIIRKEPARIRSDCVATVNITSLS